jgi:hypothetical protein
MKEQLAVALQYRQKKRAKPNARANKMRDFFKTVLELQFVHCKK